LCLNSAEGTFLRGGDVNSKTFPWLGASIIGSLGGWLGFQIGPMTGYMVGVVATGLGFYLTRRFVREYLE
jgi:hypothetical protein